jgi:hypothetical protein
LPGVFNVGWLGSRADISRGAVPLDVVQALTRVASKPVLLTRGQHLCEFCGHFRGNGEIWIRGDDARVYASPWMLLHYVATHNYLPPAIFLAALLDTNAALSDGDCNARIHSHRRKLETAPTPEDILVPYYSARLYWRHSSFLDLRAFESFVSEAFPFRFTSFALSDIGYFVQTECEHPELLLSELVAQLAPSRPAPFQCAFTLLYVGGHEQICSTVPQP